MQSTHSCSCGSKHRAVVSTVWSHEVRKDERSSIVTRAMTAVGAASRAIGDRFGSLFGRHQPVAPIETPDPVVAANPIDEAAWESFPASDPPARY